MAACGCLTGVEVCVAGLELKAARSRRSASPALRTLSKPTVRWSAVVQSSGFLRLGDQAGGFGAADAGDVVLVFEEDAEGFVDGSGG